MSESNDSKDGYGLDKQARLNAKRLGKDEEESSQSAPLDPPFPYRMVPFDAEFFGL
jgi:hypothetical protein